MDEQATPVEIPRVVTGSPAGAVPLPAVPCRVVVVNDDGRVVQPSDVRVIKVCCP